MATAAAATVAKGVIIRLLQRTRVVARGLEVAAEAMREHSPAGIQAVVVTVVVTKITPIS
jgi:hypothetical protein